MRLIDANALIKRLEDTSQMPIPAWLRMEIVNAPTIEPRKGKWMPVQGYVMGHQPYRCSCCNAWRGSMEWKFCPHCGARMKEGEEQNERN